MAQFFYNFFKFNFRNESGQGQVEWGYEEPVLVEVVCAYDRGLEQDEL